MTTAEPSACARCRGIAAHRLLAALRDGLPVTAAGVSRTAAYGHRRNCAAFAEAWAEAAAAGAPHRAERRVSRRPPPYSSAMSRIVREIDAGAPINEAARRAGVSPETERTWANRYPSYRRLSRRAKEAAQ